MANVTRSGGMRRAALALLLLAVAVPAGADPGQDNRAPDLRDCPVGPFRLCLSHTPDYVRWARRHGIDLMLAGHVHGGQVRVPVLESLFVPSCYSRKYDCGTFHEPPTVTYVSRGLAGKIPLRWNCRPEVTRITLRTETWAADLRR